VFSVKQNLSNSIYDNDFSHGSQVEDLNRTVQFYLKNSTYKLGHYLKAKKYNS
jgi:hypothetical protein